MTDNADNTFDRALDGTAYWTLSLYIAADRLADIYDAPLKDDPGKALRAAQMRHKPSFALRNAIDPLFNDIADRDFFGRPRDFLFAAGLGADDGGRPWNLGSAADAIRTETELVFKVPQQFHWVTEGVRFNCDLNEALHRKVRLRRFWFAHSDGALSYHLSFEHCYKTGRQGSERDILHDPHGIQTYYFLSLLQKLAAPKEFMLGEEQLEGLTRATGDAAYLNPFLSAVQTGIDPLDKIAVQEDAEENTFWRFVRGKFVNDARMLLGEVFALPGELSDSLLEAMPDMTEVIEVPGLKLPRCRYLLHINDERFFNRLLPINPLTQEGLARKQVVRTQCFVPFRAMINGATHRTDGGAPQSVWLGGDKGLESDLGWHKFDLSGTYEEWIRKGVFLDPENEIEGEYQPYPNEPALRQGLHSGTALICYDARDQPIDPPIPVYIPAYETGRADCLDYLFLAGFNQNIIDWLNQDTSEILDSIDPIYPTEDLQADERFFVRYANHRGMITYVAGSRSLEIGNDYIGTCPYAFLIHVLALHNEFLARDHEKRTAERIEKIDRVVQKLRKARLAETLRSRSQVLETAINNLKLDGYRKYERHRYLNIFRYDTEAAVFEKLAELRGTDWRGEAMDKALATLEEYASDLDRRQAKALDDEQRERDGRLGALIGLVGVISGVGTLFSLVEYLEGHPHLSLPGKKEPLGAYLLGNLAWPLALFGLAMLLFLLVAQRREVWKAISDLLRPAAKANRPNPARRNDPK